jgi:hypothetical protein
MEMVKKTNRLMNLIKPVFSDTGLGDSGDILDVLSDLPELLRARTALVERRTRFFYVRDNLFCNLRTAPAFFADLRQAIDGECR